MYIAYIDETGDVGLIHSPTHYYCLTTILVHEDQWNNNFIKIKELRSELRKA